MALCWSFVASVHGQQGIPLEDLLSRFPGYHLLTMQERDPDVQAFLHQNFPKENPSLVRADFNGDGIMDYAVLVENDKTRITKFLILLCSANGKCKSVYETNETAGAEITYLRAMKSGSKIYEMGASPGDAPTVKLRSAGIELNYFEKASIVLYWDQKLQKIKEVPTSD